MYSAEAQVESTRRAKVFTQPNLAKLALLAERFKKSQLNSTATLREEFSEDDEFETNEALLFMEAILNNLVYDLEYQSEEQSTYQFEKELDFGEGIISGNTLLGFLADIENSVDSIRTNAEQTDSTKYLVSVVDLVWDIEQITNHIVVHVIVVLNSGHIPLIDVPCDLLNRSTWNGVSLNEFIPDSRSSNFPVPFANIGASVYMRSYLALTYLLNKAVCNPNLAVLATPAGDPNGYWLYNIDVTDWEYVCGSGNNPHWNHSSMLWSNVVNPPYGAPLQNRAHVVNEFNYIITLANNNRPHNKHVVHYAVYEGPACRAPSGQVVRRSHKLTVTYGNWYYVSTVQQ